MDPIYEFLTLGLSSVELREMVLADDALIARIQAKLPQSTFAHDPVWRDSPMSGEAFAYDDFDLRRTLTKGYYALGSLYGASSAYNLLYDLFYGEYPDIERNNVYHRMFIYAIDVVPECVDSVEADELIFSLVRQAMTMPDAQGKKYIREQIRELFHLNETKKRPRWIHGSSWPVWEGKPMRFLGQRRDGEIVRYTFEDPDTGIRRIVEQCY